MAVFAVSFRVGDEGDRQGRWTSLVDTIRKQATTERTWEETTSFFVLESPKSADDLAHEIYIKSDMISDWDKLLVINLSLKEHASRGKIAYPATLNALMAAR